MPEFKPWPKIARLNRNIVVTEKIDGTNAAVGILSAAEQADLGIWTPGADEEPAPLVYAQSRTRLITPEDDNFGFAKWVQTHSSRLAELLGPGLHFGEWWGSGIQRNYGLVGRRRFSLFNVARFGDPAGGLDAFEAIDMRVVPTLYEGPFDQGAIEDSIALLRDAGSMAEPGFMKPEGIVVYMSASRTMHKVTIEGDASPKSLDAA